MKTKSIIILGLATTVLASALVFDGMSHRRTATSNQAISQSPVTNAAAAPNTTDPATGGQPAQGQPADDQSANAAADSTTATDAGQDPAPGDADPAQADADASQPAAQPIVVPAGTTLTVRLGEDLGSSISEVGQRFSATLDQDVVVGGQTVIAAGAAVSGKVLSARPAGQLAGEANLQLQLTSVSTDNANLRLATSVRSFGPKIKGKNKVGRFMKGLAKRASGQEREVLLAQQTAYSFTLKRGVQVQ